MSEATPERVDGGVGLGEFKWRPFVTKRVLVKEAGFPKGDTYEYTVLEVSPSGRRVKFQNAVGRCFWTDHQQYLPVEVLP